MHPKIIGITGRKFSGKDTSGEFLVKNFGYERIAFADALKEGIKLIFGFSSIEKYIKLLKLNTLFRYPYNTFTRWLKTSRDNFKCYHNNNIYFLL